MLNSEWQVKQISTILKENPQNCLILKETDIKNIVRRQKTCWYMVLLEMHE